MPNNAELIFDSINQYSDIKNLLGKQEDIFLDFKETKSINGRLLDDDKRNFSKAASGFAHQEGGVLVWGIRARKDSTGVDQAIKLVPILKTKQFLSDLNDYIKYANDPVVDGIKHKVVFVNDSEKLNKGFAVSYFPRSEREHQTKDGKFYKRHGDSFVSLSTTDIKALFFRSLSPDLVLENVGSGGKHPDLQLELSNIGKGTAEYPSVMFGLPSGVSGSWYDGEGNLNYKVGPLLTIQNPPFTKQWIANPGFVLHPEQGVIIARVVITNGPATQEIPYKVFAKNMVPKTGKIIIQPL